MPAHGLAQLPVVHGAGSELYHVGLREGRVQPGWKDSIFGRVHFELDVQLLSVHRAPVLGLQQRVLQPERNVDRENLRGKHEAHRIAELEGADRPDRVLARRVHHALQLRGSGAEHLDAALGFDCSRHCWSDNLRRVAAQSAAVRFPLYSYEIKKLEK